VTTTILSNIIKNTLSNNVPHFLKKCREFNDSYWLLKISAQSSRKVEESGVQAKEGGRHETYNTDSRNLIRFPVPKFHLP